LSQRLPRDPDEIEKIMAEAAARRASGGEAADDARRPDVTADENAIRAQIARYAKSINDLDLDLAAQVWWDSPEVSFLHPLGHDHGFEEIKADIYQKIMGGLFSERALSPHDIAIHVYGDSAVAEFYWDFNAKMKKDGSPVTTHGRETQVYERKEGTWRLVHVHYSGAVPNQAF
jgi:ketosteroid isomerase-like protein